MIIFGVLSSTRHARFKSHSLWHLRPNLNLACFMLVPSYIKELIDVIYCGSDVSGCLTVFLVQSGVPKLLISQAGRLLPNPASHLCKRNHSPPFLNTLFFFFFRFAPLFFLSMFTSPEDVKLRTCNDNTWPYDDFRNLIIFVLFNSGRPTLWQQRWQRAHSWSLWDLLDGP